MKKEHYKLYKAGKLWLTAMIVAFGVAAGSTAVHADSVAADSPVTATKPGSAASGNTTSTGSSATSSADSSSADSSAAASSAAALSQAISDANAANSAAKAASGSLASYNQSLASVAKTTSDAAAQIQSSAASASDNASAAASAQTITDSLAQQWMGDTLIQSTATAVGDQMKGVVASNAALASNAAKSAASLAAQIASEQAAVSSAVAVVNSYATVASDAASRAAAIKDVKNLKSAQDFAQTASTAASQATSAASSAVKVYSDAQKDITSATSALTSLAKAASAADQAISQANTSIQTLAKTAADKYGINLKPDSGHHQQPSQAASAQTPAAPTANLSKDMKLNDNGQIVWTNANGKQNQGWLVNDSSWFYFNNGAAYTGWLRYNGAWYYLSPSDGRSQTGLRTINGHTYYFDNSSSAAWTGWVLLDDSEKQGQYWYYFDNTNAWALTGWQKINNRWYYFTNDGANAKGIQKLNGRVYAFDDKNAWALTGWQKLNGSWYYFDNTNAWALTGWQVINGNWYYFDLADGTVASGFKQIGNQTFYFDPTNAWMDHGWLYRGGQWYYLNPNHDGSFGALKTGWQYINGAWYYLDPNNGGIMLKGSQWLSWGNTTSTYIFSDNGKMYANGFYKDDTGNTYYLTASGAADSGLQTLNGHSYYFDPQKRNAMSTGDVIISGQHYYFNPLNGQKLQGLVITDSGDVLNYTGENGALSTSDLTANGATLHVDANGKVDLSDLKDGVYQFSNGKSLSIKNHKATTGWNGLKYFDPTTGDELYGWQKISPQGTLNGEGSWYFFGSDGNAVTGWFKSPYGLWYYMNNKGAALTGWQRLAWDGATNWYYFDDTNANMYANRFASLRWNGGQVADYYFNGGGVMVTGWQTINGARYYFNGDGTLSNYSTRLINWFRSREGKISYNYNGGSRNGTDGTADCSGALTQALQDSGCSPYNHLYYTNELPDYLVANGYRLVAQGRGQVNVQHGDVVLWGSDGNWMCMVISTFGADPNCISVSNYTNSAKSHNGTAVHEMSYNQYWNFAGYPTQYVYRPARAEWQ